MSYKFRKDCGEIIEVDFDTAMNAKDGFLDLGGGKYARRIVESNTDTVSMQEDAESKKNKRIKENKPIVSDSLGFPIAQLADFEKHRSEHGHSGIEFRPDPQVPQFIQVHCSSPQAQARYMKSRGFSDHNKKNGSAAMISPEQLEQAKRRVIQHHGV